MAVHKLYRVTRKRGKITRQLVSEHDSLRTGFSAGQDAVYADRENAFALYRENGDGTLETRVARFASSRLAVEVDLPAAGLLGEIIS